jgi:hypothetical protein
MSTMYEGEANVMYPEEQPLRAVPPAQIRLMIEHLFAETVDENGFPARHITANAIPENILNHLNAFASSVAHRPTRLAAIRPCGACYLYNQPGNLALMEEGLPQCWKC